MTDALLDKIRQAIEDVRTTGYEPRTIILHPADYAWAKPEVARLLGVPEHDVTDEMIVAFLIP